MNRSKRPMFDKFRKKMAKAVRGLKNTFTSPESSKYADEETAKELAKKFPKSVKRKQELLTEIEKKYITKRVRTKKGAVKKGTSKRTATGTVPADTSPANAHREGQRWIKTLTKQTLATQKVQDHHGRKK